MRWCQWGFFSFLLCWWIFSVLFCFVFAWTAHCAERNGARVSPAGRLIGRIVRLHPPGGFNLSTALFLQRSSRTFPLHPQPDAFVQWRTSGPSHRATCTYCWSHALTPPNGISRSHMLCSTVESAGPCSFVMKVLSLSPLSFQLLQIGRYFSNESIYIHWFAVCLFVCVYFLFFFLATCWIC